MLSTITCVLGTQDVCRAHSYFVYYMWQRFFCGPTTHQFLQCMINKNNGTNSHGNHKSNKNDDEFILVIILHTTLIIFCNTIYRLALYLPQGFFGSAPLNQT